MPGKSRADVRFRMDSGVTHVPPRFLGGVLGGSIVDFKEEVSGREGKSFRVEAICRSRDESETRGWK